MKREARRRQQSRPVSPVKQRAVTYSYAAAPDEKKIRRLLTTCGLKTLSLRRNLKFFIVAKASRKVVGVIGLEKYGRMGLLRSLCVDGAYRNRGIAKKLNSDIMADARLLKIRRLYLFTWAEEFASRLGFRRIEKKKIPKSLKSTWQYRLSKFYPVIPMVKTVADGQSRGGQYPQMEPHGQSPWYLH